MPTSLRDHGSCGPVTRLGERSILLVVESTVGLPESFGRRSRKHPCCPFLDKAHNGLEPATCAFTIGPATLRHAVLKGEFVIEIISSFHMGAEPSFAVETIPYLKSLRLRQRLAVLNRKRPRPKLKSLGRLFGIALRRCWSRWTAVPALLNPDTVIGLHRAGFLPCWRWRSRLWGGRPKITGDSRP